MQLQPNKTARLTVLLTPADKQRIEAHARESGLSVGEYVRRASDAYDADLDPAMLASMVDQFHANVTAMRATLADTLAHVAANNAAIEALRNGRHGDR